MSPREPSGRQATLPRDAFGDREITPMPVAVPWQAAAVPVAPESPVSWPRLVKDIGFPIVMAGALAAFVVRKDDQALRERTEMAREHRAQLNLILDAHTKDREIIRQALERQNALLEQMPGKMREALRSAGGRTRERGER